MIYSLLEYNIKHNSIQDIYLYFRYISVGLPMIHYNFLKVHISGVESNMNTTIRTFVVLIMDWIIVFM